MPSLPRRFLAGNVRRTQGQCPSGCANPKACTNPHGAADSLDCKRSSRVSCTIYAGYGAPGGRHQTCQLSPGLFQDEIGHGFHKLSTVCGSGVVGEVDGDLRYSGSPMPSCAMDSKRVDRLTKASLILPVGPLRCLAIMISAIPSSSGSSGL